jgi:homoserine dehydrogenase
MKKIALLGYGTVGSNVARILTSQKSLDAGKKLTESGYELASIVTINPDEVDPKHSHLVTSDGKTAIQNADIVVEVIGGTGVAYEFAKLALSAGKDFVTANKALLATHYTELFDLADSTGARIGYEASVGGTVPIIRVIRQHLLCDKITKISGIVNGTTNFILDMMFHENLEFDVALKQAQELGFAEADPTADIEGIDPACKGVILANLAFADELKAAGMPYFSIEDCVPTGISDLTLKDIAQARSENKVIKLIAEITLDAAGKPMAPKVYPVRLPLSDPLASIAGSGNAVTINSKNAHEIVLAGPGAGGAPTAVSVVADVLELI